MDNVTLDNLTDKERLFVHHYLTDCNMNASKAVVVAGYSERSKYDIGYELLRKPNIAAYIKQYLDNHSISKQELLKRLSDVAKNVGSEYITAEGTINLDELLADGYGHLIKEVRRYKNGKVRVLFHDSAKALDSLARIHKLIDEGLSVTVNIQEELDAKQRLIEKLNQLDARYKQYNNYGSNTDGTEHN